MKKINRSKDISLLNKIYKPKLIESVLYKFWEKNNFFKYLTKSKESFCIVIPPPNITGNLHIGHAFQQTIIDILIRYNRMNGKKTLCQFGLDHAGIATQMIIENKIKIEENKTRYDYGREKFIKKIFFWKNSFSNTISKQIRKLGNSINWERERFTMDEGFSKVVKEVFIRLYHDNLLYKKKKLVNWDLKLNTVISDLEVEKKSVHTLFWYIRYPLINGIKTSTGDNYLLICTNRPETIFADVAIAVNPKDIRYKHLIGEKVLLPLINRDIPIIGDESVQIQSETGCLKISPGHDFNDYKIALKNKLPIINIFNLNGTIRKKPKIINNSKNIILPFKIPVIYCGLDRFLARKTIVNDLEKRKIIFCSKLKKTNLLYGDRSSSLIEPMLTNQWYIRIQPLAKEAISAVKKGRIKFISKQYENMYFSWMNKIEDWCISRQLWWGHRIPVWYDKNKAIYVGFNENEIRKKYKIDSNIILYQDEDVLDTWFSSALWTFTTLGWNKDKKTLKIFHPTNVLVSGFDIIFFWIARMIMLTLYCVKDKNGVGEIPFKKIYITGLIRDKNGNKMSKSKGNVIDPIDIIDGISLENLILKRTTNMIQPKLTKKIIFHTKKEYPNGIRSYGADSLRFTFSSLSSISRNINLNINRLNGYYKFCNKIWHASRYVILMLKLNKYNNNNVKIKQLSLIDKWIITKLNQTIKLFRESINNYRFDIASNILYEFAWNQFCDWYIEWSKIIFSNKKEKEIFSTCHTLINVLENFLKLAHPIIPFITEKIWQKIKFFKGINRKTIMLESFPNFYLEKNHKKSLLIVEYIKKIIILIRKIKIEKKIDLNKKIDIILVINNFKIKKYIIENLKFILKISMLKSIHFLTNKNDDYSVIYSLVENDKIIIPFLN